MAQHNDLGKYGEQQAINYLKENGYTILERNYHYLKAEIDIIALKENVIVAVEVKTRSTDFFGSPQEFVNKKKINLMVTAMDYYVTSRNLDVEVRFDIIAITKQQSTFKIEHLEDAFLYF